MTDKRKALLLQANRPSATPIPPSLQEKMAAFANRNASSGSSSSGNQLLRTANSYPPPNVNPHPKPPTGLGGRRIKPAFSLRDIDPNILPGGGAANAGLGAGRPNVDNTDTRKPQGGAGDFGAPFANFSKIV